MTTINELVMTNEQLIATIDMLQNEPVEFLAGIMAKEFTTIKKDNGKEITVRKDRKNNLDDDWIYDLIYSSHKLFDVFPDDWVYSTISSIVDSIDDDEDNIHELVDRLVDISNSNLYDWAKNWDWSIEEAEKEFGKSSEGIIKKIMIGQYYIIDQIAHHIYSILSELAEEEAGRLQDILDSR